MFATATAVLALVVSTGLQLTLKIAKVGAPEVLKLGRAGTEAEINQK